MTTLIDEAKQALEALDKMLIKVPDYFRIRESLRTAIKEAEQQEPVAAVHCVEGYLGLVKQLKEVPNGTKLYTQPTVSKEWQGLTDEDIDVLKQLTNWSATGTLTSFARSIEQRLKELNT